MKLKPDAMRLYVVTDRSWLNCCPGAREQTFLVQIAEILSAGATFLQLREKGLGKEAFLQEAVAVKKLTDSLGIPLVINDNIKVCLESGADGVHLGQKDMDAKTARQLLGKDRILGVSARTVEQAIKAEADGADYLGSGAVFGTATKNDAKKLSLDTLEKICAAVSIPVVAIGGIHENNIMKLAGTGVAGAAVVSAVFARDDVGQATRRLRDLSDKMMGDDR